MRSCVPLFQALQVEFSLGDETNVMSVVVDRANNAIFYHVDETENFEAVQLLQDYDAVSDRHTDMYTHT